MPGRRHPAEWVIESLRNDHDRASFSCGNASLDRYLKEQARQDLVNGATGLCVVFAGSIGANGFGVPASEAAIARGFDRASACLVAADADEREAATARTLLSELGG